MWMSAALRKNTPRTSSAERGAVGVNAVGSVGVENLLIVYVGSRLCIYAVVLRGERLHKNYQAAYDTFLYCVLKKFWESVSCLCLVLLVYFFRECFLALCMFMRRGVSALGTAESAVLLSGVATPRAGLWSVDLT